MNRRQKMLRNNDYNWYVVKLLNNRIELQHESNLSAILQCGMVMEEFGIKSIQRCGGQSQ